MTAPKRGGHFSAGQAGVWVDAARWLAFWEAARWAEATWKAQNVAAWQLAKVGRWLQRDGDDGQ
jgi:hypothetical protein